MENKKEFGFEKDPDVKSSGYRLIHVGKDGEEGATGISTSHIDLIRIEKPSDELYLFSIHLSSGKKLTFAFTSKEKMNDALKVVYHSMHRRA